MLLDSEKALRATADAGDKLDDLSGQLHLLEVETFEIEDVVDLGQNPAMMQSSTSTCSTTSSTSTSSS